MGFFQTYMHRSGKHSYHQIGLVRGQFGDVSEDKWLDFVAAAAFDGWEEASWELELKSCATEDGAAECAKERVAKAKQRGLEIFTVAVHRQGLVERFKPLAEACKNYGVTFGLECHPSARVIGDIELASECLATWDKAGYRDKIGFNLDISHMEWQGVSVIEFVRTFGDRIQCAHIRGVSVAKEHTRAGRLGGRRPMGRKLNGWNFVTAGARRDANSVEEIKIALNRVGVDSAVSIEWEDSDLSKPWHAPHEPRSRAGRRGSTRVKSLCRLFSWPLFRRVTT